MFTNLINKPPAPLAMPVQPMVIGFIFKDKSGVYYRSNGHGHVNNRRNAYIFLMDEIVAIFQTRQIFGTYGWGTKRQGHWIAVYARLPAMNCHS